MSELSLFYLSERNAAILFFSTRFPFLSLQYSHTAPEFLFINIITEQSS